MASHRAYKLTNITAPPDKKQAFLDHCRICQGSWHRILCYLTFTEWQIQECGNLFQQKIQVLYFEPGRAVECEGVCNLGGHPRPRLTHPVFF